MGARYAINAFKPYSCPNTSQETQEQIVEARYAINAFKPYSCPNTSQETQGQIVGARYAINACKPYSCHHRGQTSKSLFFFLLLGFHLPVKEKWAKMYKSVSQHNYLSIFLKILSFFR